MPASSHVDRTSAECSHAYGCCATRSSSWSSRSRSRGIVSYSASKYTLSTGGSCVIRGRRYSRTPGAGQTGATMDTYRGATYISTDSHVTEPIELYAERIDRDFRDRAPRIE